MSTPKLYVKDKVYIPLRDVNVEKVKDTYTIQQFLEQNCRKCEYLDNRFGPACTTCKSYLGESRLYKIREIKGKSYIGLPLGDKRNIEKNAGIYYGDYKIVDLRSKVPFDYKVKFTLPLRPHQVKLVKDFKKNGSYGLIESPPRTGKTPLMVYIGIDLGYKTAMIADQIEFLDQFNYHIVGNEAEDIPCFTNIPELEKKYKKKLHGFPKTEEDFKTFQFMTMTYQSFLSEKGKKKLKLLMENVGTICVDEAHSSAAKEFLSLLNTMYPHHRYGVTGTVERKDGRHKILKKVLGPITAKTTIEAMKPKVRVRSTGIKFRSVPKHWTYAMQRLATNEKRNEQIVKQILKDVKKGHSVVVPLVFRKHIAEIIRMVNQEYGRKIAAEFVGGGGEQNKRRRKAVLADAKSGKIKVVVGIRRLLQRGLNVPRWSCIHIVMPISNKPNLRQETKRVCTPMEGKMQPIIHLWFDENMGQSIGCAKSTVGHMHQFGYKFSKDEKTEAALELLTKRKGRGDAFDDEQDQYKARNILQMWDK